MLIDTFVSDDRIAIYLKTARYKLLSKVLIGMRKVCIKIMHYSNYQLGGLGIPVPSDNTTGLGN